MRTNLTPVYHKILKQLKSNGCAICGYNKNCGALVFHHSNPEEKLFHLVMRSMQRTDKKIINEINKCILLCVRCHIEIHMPQMNIEDVK